MSNQKIGDGFRPDELQQVFLDSLVQTLKIPFCSVDVLLNSELLCLFSHLEDDVAVLSDAELLGFM